MNREERFKFIIHASIQAYVNSSEDSMKETIATVLSVLTSQLTSSLAATFATGEVDREKFIVLINSITQDIKKATIGKYDEITQRRNK